MADPSRQPDPLLDLAEFEDLIDEDGEGDRVARDTVRPAFDVERYAEVTIGRERLATITDEAATEEARIASVLMDSRPPPKRDDDGGVEVEVAVRYADVDALATDEQLAFWRARLAPMSRVPLLTRELASLGPLIEDPKTAYLLGFVDGLLPLETLVEVAGLPELDALRILDRAVEQRLVTFRADAPHR